MQNKNMEIAVLGGGIAGLAAAKSFSLLGFSVRVFEKTKELQSIGGGITIYPHGARALDCLGLGANPYQDEIHHYSLYDGDNLIFKNSLTAIKEQFGYSLVSFSRHGLQNLLAESLPDGCLHLGLGVKDLREKANGVELVFEDGATKTVDLVVLANGIHSQLFRKKILNTAVEEKYCGYSFWGGFLENEHVLDFKEHATRITFGRNKLSFLLSLPNKRQWWYLVGQFPEEKWKNADKFGLAQDIFSGWCATADHILSRPKECFSFGLPCREIPFLQKWHTDRVIGIGDCVHAMGPTAGQGANTALVEALVLAHALKETASFSEAFKLFTTSRNAVTGDLYEIERVSAATKMQADADAVSNRNETVANSELLELFAPFMSVIECNKDVFQYFENRQLP